MRALALGAQIITRGGISYVQERVLCHANGRRISPPIFNNAWLRIPTIQLIIAIFAINQNCFLKRVWGAWDNEWLSRFRLRSKSQDMTDQIRPKSALPKVAVMILAAGYSCWAGPIQDSAPSKVLIRWVGEVRKAGIAEDQIRNNAASTGWQDRLVEEDGANKPVMISQTSVPIPEGAGAVSTNPAAEGSNKSLSGVKPAPGSGPSPQAGKSRPSSDKADVVDRGVPDDYQIGTGDVLHIGVFHEPDATVQSVVVRTDGKISMPLIKEVAVLGLTPSQLEKQITEQLSKFLTAPDVTVIVTAINSKKVYVIGAVKKEGPLPYTYPLNVLQALSEAGGLTDFAKRKKIYVLRIKNGRQFKLAFDYDAALKGEHIELNVPLMAGDTIIVPGGQ
jgi:polysaccharide biosynthesis/export protein